MVNSLGESISNKDVKNVVFYSPCLRGEVVNRCIWYTMYVWMPNASSKWWISFLVFLLYSYIGILDLWRFFCILISRDLRDVISFFVELFGDFGVNVLLNLG